MWDFLRWRTFCNIWNANYIILLCFGSNLPLYTGQDILLFHQRNAARQICGDLKDLHSETDNVL